MRKISPYSLRLLVQESRPPHGRVFLKVTIAFKLRRSSISFHGGSLVYIGPPPPPVCSGHKESCVLRTVKKKGPNMNRQFWACARAAGHSSDKNAQCNFFMWASTKR